MFKPPRRLSPRATVRRQVFADGGAALHQGQGAHAHKLVDQAMARKKRSVLHRHMPAQQHAIGKDDAIPQAAVMRDMRVGHIKSPRANHRLLRRLVGAMHRHVLPEDIMVAYPQAGQLAVVFQILRRLANHAPGIEPIMRADNRHARQVNIRPNHAVRAHLHVRVYNRIRPHLHGRVQLRAGMNYRGGVNHSRGSGSANMGHPGPPPANRRISNGRRPRFPRWRLWAARPPGWSNAPENPP